MKKTLGNHILIIGLILMSFTSCVSVKSYQKMYINDEEMELNSRKIQKGEQDFQVYREGASGGNGGKTGGGCGCN